MYCPEHILINKGPIMLTMYGDADIRWCYVPFKWKANPLRYELIIRSPRFIRINEEGRWNRALSNLLFKYIWPKLCKWFGIHQRLGGRGGDKFCLHCDVGKLSPEDFS